ncbi:uncharacterized protein LOC135937601 [Cloeon dipterum]|uniref:uncharacterized protein LOC135937601 n=1 Tax=Cloeon dipterum TaxID=197152 RepID=UPI0032203BFF
MPNCIRSPEIARPSHSESPSQKINNDYHSNRSDIGSSSGVYDSRPSYARSKDARSTDARSKKAPITAGKTSSESRLKSGRFLSKEHGTSSSRSYRGSSSGVFDSRPSDAGSTDARSGNASQEQQANSPSRSDDTAGRKSVSKKAPLTACKTSSESSLKSGRFLSKEHETSSSRSNRGSSSGVCDSRPSDARSTDARSTDARSTDARSTDARSSIASQKLQANSSSRSDDRVGRKSLSKDTHLTAGKSSSKSSKST